MGTKKSKNRAGAGIGRAILAVSSRVGFTPKDRLTWLVSVAQRRIEDFTPGERDDVTLALSLYVFTDPARSPRQGRAEFLPYLGEPRTLPTKTEIQEILTRCEEQLRAVARRENLTAPSRPRQSEHLEWEKGAGRYAYREVYAKWSWTDGVRFALWRQLEAYGHLVKECRAPRRRGKPKEICGALFVAKRPNQDFCSSTCRGRAGIRAVRARRRKGGQ